MFFEGFLGANFGTNFTPKRKIGRYIRHKLGEDPRDAAFQRLQMKFGRPGSALFRHGLLSGVVDRGEGGGMGMGMGNVDGWMMTMGFF